MGRNNVAFNSIMEDAFSSRGQQNTSTSAGLPSTILETLIPGYGPIQEFLLYSLGFDVTVLVSLGAALWLAMRITSSLYSVLGELVNQNFM